MSRTEIRTWRKAGSPGPRPGVRPSYSSILFLTLQVNSETP